MAQTGYTPILIYSSSTVSQAPSAGNLTNSTLGSELAINITDGKLFYKDNANAVQVIAWKTTPTTAGGTGLTSYTAGDLLYYATGTTLSKLAIGASKTILTSNGAAPQWSTNLDTTQGGTGLTTYTAGDLPYYATGTTLSKLGIGAANTVLTSSGTAPQWTVQSSLSVGTAANLLSNATTGVMQIVGPGAGTTRVMTIPNANFTAARTDASQTFTGDQTFTNNVGIDAAPRAWAAGFPALDVGSGAGGGFAANTSAGFVYVTSNAFYNGSSWVRKGTDWATLYAAGDGVHYFYTAVSGSAGTNISFTETVQFDDTGNVKIANGNFVVGTSGKGIDFSATPGTGTSELLADYEEGTWTPSFSCEGGTATVTYSTQSGQYTKIGRTVICTFKMDWTASTMTGNVLRLSGVPFTSNSANMSGFVTQAYRIGFTNVSGSTGTQLLIQTYDNANCAFMTAGNSLNPADGRLGPAQIAATGTLHGTLIYNV